MAAPGVSEHTVLSVAEASERLNNLSEAGLLRIKKASQYLSFGGARSSADLRQEAFQRVIAGSRKCPRHLALDVFLVGVMRSIAWADRKLASRTSGLSLVPKEHSIAADTFVGPDPRLSPEDVAIRAEELAKLKREYLALFNDDLGAQTLAEGIMEEMEGQELRDFVGLSQKDFDSKRRLVRRRTDKAFPNGWRRS